MKITPSIDDILSELRMQLDIYHEQPQGPITRGQFYLPSLAEPFLPSLFDDQLVLKPAESGSGNVFATLDTSEQIFNGQITGSGSGLTFMRHELSGMVMSLGSRDLSTDSGLSIISADKAISHPNVFLHGEGARKIVSILIRDGNRALSNAPFLVESTTTIATEAEEQVPYAKLNAVYALHTRSIDALKLLGLAFWIVDAPQHIALSFDHYAEGDDPSKPTYVRYHAMRGLDLAVLDGVQALNFVALATMQYLPDASRTRSRFTVARPAGHALPIAFL